MRRHNTHVLIPIAQLVTLALYVAIGYLYVISGLAVPLPFLLLLWACWGALLVVGFQQRNSSAGPRWLPHLRAPCRLGLGLHWAR